MRGAASAAGLFAMTLAGACDDSGAPETNSLGGPTDPAECAKVQSDAVKVLEKAESTRLELQSLIQRSASACANWEHGVVVQPICKAHPDACLETLEPELRQ